MNKFQYCFRVAGVTIEVNIPWKPLFEDKFVDFIVQNRNPEVCYSFQIFNNKEQLVLLSSENGISYYTDGAYFYRSAPTNLPGDPEFYVCRRSVKEYIIYYPSELDENPPEEFRFTSMISWEEHFLDYNAFYLHSSCVSLDGQGIVFTAPSGTGKSTQAELWEKYLGAEILNGDRTIVKREVNGWKGYGSPYAGSSNIYKNKSTDLQAIIILEQGSENQLSKVSPREAFVTLYRETVQNPWNREYMEKMMDLLERAMQEIPIYKLTCRPDREAVELVYKTVFGNEEGNCCDRI